MNPLQDSLEQKKEERMRKWFSEHPHNPTVIEMKRRIDKEITSFAVREFIAEKRKEGKTYAEIGEILGFTRQRAHQLSKNYENALRLKQTRYEGKN